MERLVLLSVRWEIQAVLYTRTITVNKSPMKQMVGSRTVRQSQGLKLERGFKVVGLGREGRSFVIYRSEILRLLQAEKPARDALVFELPALMGFRTREMATWRIEWSNIQTEETLVLDAKKHKLIPLPLSRVVIKHLEEAADGRSSGLVIRNESTACYGRETPLTNKAFLDIYHKYARLLRLYPNPKEYSPVVLRRFFAAEWYYHQHLSLVTLSRLMRHGNVKITLIYVDGFVFDEDIKRDYDTFQSNAMKDFPIQKVKP